MYYVEFNDGREITLHVGDGGKDDRLIDRLRDDIGNIKMIQADGHELEAIQRKFIGPLGICTVPMSNDQVCQWWGDIAKTIHANMLSYRGFGM